MITRNLSLSVSAQRAWTTWTTRIDLWWPPSHRPIGGRMHLEPGPGGRIFERTPEGEESDFGVIREWDPPHRLTYDFFLGSSAETPSQVEVVFTDTPTGSTVAVVHRRHRVPEARWGRAVHGYRRAWPDLFESFQHLLESP